MTIIPPIQGNPFDFTQFFNLQGISTGDLTQTLHAVAVLVLNIFLQVLVVFTGIVKVIIGLIK